MKFTASNQAWIRGIEAVHNATGKTVSNELVKNIFVSCGTENAVFMATNLNLSIRCEIEANVVETGQVVIPTDIITRVVKDFPSGDVVFEVKNNVVHITGGEYKVKINGYAAEEFPSFVNVKEKVTFSMEVYKLKEMIKKTIFAATQEKARFELDGVCFDIRDKILNCVSTDGRRLAWFMIDELEIDAEDTAIMVPTKTLQEVANSLPDEGEVNIKFEERAIEFSCADVVVVSNLLKYNFPQYYNIFPKEFNSTAYVNKADFDQAVRRASNVASAETNMVVIKIETNQIDTYAERLEIGGECRDKIAAEYSGETVENRYNFRFLQEFFRVVDGDVIQIDLIKSSKPAIFKDKNKSNYLYLVMPMKPPETEVE